MNIFFVPVTKLALCHNPPFVHYSYPDAMIHYKHFQLSYVFSYGFHIKIKYNVAAIQSVAMYYKHNLLAS